MNFIFIVVCGIAWQSHKSSFSIDFISLFSPEHHLLICVINREYAMASYVIWYIAYINSIILGAEGRRQSTFYSMPQCATVWKAKWRKWQLLVYCHQNHSHPCVCIGVFGWKRCEHWTYRIYMMNFRHVKYGTVWVCVCDIATNTQKMLHILWTSLMNVRTTKRLLKINIYIHTRARAYISENSRFDTFKLEFLSLSIHRIP